MSVASEVFALRSSVGVSRAPHVALVRVEGEDAFELMQLASTQSPYAREGRVRHALFLRDDGSVFADAFIVKVESAFLVLAEGPGAAAVATWITQLRDRQKLRATVHAIDEQAVLGVDGPYAWELVAMVLGTAVLGMPYLTLMRRDDVLCVRAGKTGEYGYLIIGPVAAIEVLHSRLLELGKPLDVASVGLAALDVCALESWHFSMRTLRESTLATPLTPIELQLQWRVVYTRNFEGADALRARRAQGPDARVTCFTSNAVIVPGERVLLASDEVGEVLACVESPTLGAAVGVVLVKRSVAHPGLTMTARTGTPLRTCTASLVNNLSLRVQPHKHAYATRAALEAT